MRKPEVPNRKFRIEYRTDATLDCVLHMEVADISLCNTRATEPGWWAGVGGRAPLIQEESYETTSALLACWPCCVLSERSAGPRAGQLRVREQQHQRIEQRDRVLG